MTALFNPAVTSELRFRSRHVHKTISAYMEEKLKELGWVTAPINFGTMPITFQEIQPDENGIAIKTNTVAITIGDVQEDLIYQLGGGLYSVLVPVFFDVYAADASVAQSISEDIKEQVSREMVIPLYDWSVATAPVKTTATIEFENAVGPERPGASVTASDFRKYWRVVKVSAQVYYAPA